MKKIWMTGLSAILMLPGLALAQTITVQQGVKVGKVYVTGENPGIRLLDKAGGTVLTAVSYWRHRNLAGLGTSPLSPRVTESRLVTCALRLSTTESYRLSTTEITTKTDPTFTARPYTVIEAKFVDSGQERSALPGTP